MGKQSSVRGLALAAVLGISALGLAACGEEEVAEGNTEERIERGAEAAAERTGEAIENTADAIKQGVERAGEAIDRRTE